MKNKVPDFVSAPLLSVADAAKYLGVSRTLVYQLIAFGDVIAVKAGGSVRIEKKSLEQYRGKVI